MNGEQEPGRRELQWWALARVLVVAGIGAMAIATQLRVERVAFTQGMTAGHRAAEFRDRVRASQDTP